VAVVVCVEVGEGVPVLVPVELGVDVLVSVQVGDGVLVDVGVQVAVVEGVAASAAVAVRLGVEVRVAVGVAGAVGVLVAVAVSVGATVFVGVSVGAVVAVGILVAVGVQEGVAVGLDVEVLSGKVAVASSGSGVPGVCDGEGVEVDVNVGTIPGPVPGVGEPATPSTVGAGGVGDSSAGLPIETARRPPGGTVKMRSAMKPPITKKLRMARTTMMVTHDSELRFLIAGHVRPALSCSSQ